MQLEATLAGTHPIAADEPDRAGKLIALEVRIRRVHVDERLIMAGTTDRIDPLAWRPLIMSFCQFFGLADGMIHPSRLAEIPESMYRSQPVRPANAPPLASTTIPTIPSLPTIETALAAVGSAT